MENPKQSFKNTSKIITTREGTVLQGKNTISPTLCSNPLLSNATFGSEKWSKFYSMFGSYFVTTFPNVWLYLYQRWRNLSSIWYKPRSHRRYIPSNAL